MAITYFLPKSWRMSKMEMFNLCAAKVSRVGAVAKVRRTLIFGEDSWNDRVRRKLNQTFLSFTYFASFRGSEFFNVLVMFFLTPFAKMIFKQTSASYNGGQWSVSVLDFESAYTSCFRFSNLGFWTSDYGKSHKLTVLSLFSRRATKCRLIQQRSAPPLKLPFLCQSFLPCAGKTSWSLWRSAGGVLPCFGWRLESQKLQLDCKRKTGTAACDSLWTDMTSAFFVQARRASGWVGDVCLFLGFCSLMNLPISSLRPLKYSFAYSRVRRPGGLESSCDLDN